MSAYNKIETLEEVETVNYVVYRESDGKYIGITQRETTLTNVTTVELPFCHWEYEAPFFNKTKNKWEIKTTDEDLKLMYDINNGVYDKNE